MNPEPWVAPAWFLFLLGAWSFILCVAVPFAFWIAERAARRDE